MRSAEIAKCVITLLALIFKNDCTTLIFKIKKKHDSWINTFLINWQVPTEYSYLDDEPQEIKPLKLEVPILHMAIIDVS